MTRIAILGIASEIEHLRRRLNGVTTEANPVGTFWLGRWDQHDVVLAQCGIGKVNAAMALQRLIDRHSPTLLINCGSSGAIAPELRVGDVIIADRVVPYDAGVFLERGFVITGNELPNQGHLHWRVFFAEPRLVRLANEAAAKAGLASTPVQRQGKRPRVAPGQPGVSTATGPRANRQARVCVGAIASGDQVVFADKPKRWLQETCGALAVENEGAAVAQVATAYGLPWLVLRGISDTADSEAAFDYTSLLRYADEGSGWIAWLRLQLRRLIHVLRFRQTRTNLRRFNTGVRLANGNLAALLDYLLTSL